MDIWYVISVMSQADNLSISLIVAFVGVICWFLTVIGKRGGFSLLAAPFLVFGGLAGHAWYQINGLSLSSDQDTNVALATAAGIFLVLVIVLLVGWIAALLSTRIMRRRREQQRIIRDSTAI